MTKLAERIESIIQELAINQHKAIIKAVNKKGLMDTNWNDIDKEGGHLDSKVIATAIADSLCLDEEKVKEELAGYVDMPSYLARKLTKATDIITVKEQK